MKAPQHRTAIRCAPSVVERIVIVNNALNEVQWAKRSRDPDVVLAGTGAVMDRGHALREPPSRCG